jgi:5-methylcytosine-specific restriction endonuclease McrA
MIQPGGNRRKGSKWRSRCFKNVWLCQKGHCAECGTPEKFIWRKGGLTGSRHDGLVQIVWRTSNLELDHVEPLHRGGTNDYDNLQLLCVDCHKAKTARERSQRARGAAWA